MKVLLTNEWKVKEQPFEGMLRLEGLKHKASLLIDVVKLYNKIANKSFVYFVKDGKVKCLEWPEYCKQYKNN